MQSSALKGTGLTVKEEAADMERLFFSKQIRPVRSLAEAIILQSIEDLWNPVNKKESLKFFKSNGFELCADIAGMSNSDKMKLLKMIETPMSKHFCLRYRRR